MNLNRLLFWLIFVSAFAPHVNAETQRTAYEGRWGGRFSIDPFGQITLDLPTRTGAVIPLQLEGTYSVTNAFELLFGIRQAISISTPYNLSYFGISAGYRYYFNVYDPVKFFLSNQLSTSFARPSTEFRVLSGLQWDITDHWALFFETQLGGGIAKLNNSTPLHFLVGAGAGVEYRY